MRSEAGRGQRRRTRRRAARSADGGGGRCLGRGRLSIATPTNTRVLLRRVRATAPRFAGGAAQGGVRSKSPLPPFPRGKPPHPDDDSGAPSSRAGRSHRRSSTKPTRLHRPLRPRGRAPCVAGPGRETGGAGDLLSPSGPIGGRPKPLLRLRSERQRQPSPAQARGRTRCPRTKTGSAWSSRSRPQCAPRGSGAARRRRRRRISDRRLRAVRRSRPGRATR